MKRLALVALGILLASGCSSSNSSPSTTNGPTTTRFTADLKPANESPAITNSESVGSGSVTIDLTQTKDSTGAVSASTVNFTANLSGFPSSTVVNIAHIHTGAAGVNGGIVVNTTINPGEVVLTNGGGTFTRVAISLTNDLASQILANPAGFYFNIHTAANPGGVMRGQLVKQ
jgi:CHRD domain